MSWLHYVYFRICVSYLHIFLFIFKVRSIGTGLVWRNFLEFVAIRVAMSAFLVDLETPVINVEDWDCVDKPENCICLIYRIDFVYTRHLRRLICMSALIKTVALFVNLKWPCIGFAKKLGPQRRRRWRAKIGRISYLAFNRSCCVCSCSASTSNGAASSWLIVALSAIFCV